MISSWDLTFPISLIVSASYDNESDNERCASYDNEIVTKSLRCASYDNESDSENNLIEFYFKGFFVKKENFVR